MRPLGVAAGFPVRASSARRVRGVSFGSRPRHVSASVRRRRGIPSGGGTRFRMGLSALSAGRRGRFAPFGLPVWRESLFSCRLSAASGDGFAVSREGRFGGRPLFTELSEETVPPGILTETPGCVLPGIRRRRRIGRRVLIPVGTVSLRAAAFAAVATIARAASVRPLTATVARAVPGLRGVMILTARRIIRVGGIGIALSTAG